MNAKRASYGLNEEEQEMINGVREFAEKHVAPRAAEIDQTAQFPWDLVEQMADLDIMALPFPPAYKGIGASDLLVVMAIEELARNCASTSLILAAQALGIAQGAFDYAVDYVKTRTQFGKPIAEQQGIQFMVAEMATELEAARLLVYRAAILIDRSQAEPDLRFSQESAMAKMFASEIAVRVVDKALQLLGGYGYMTEYPLERMYRDVRITPIYEGTNQIQRLVIAREALR